MDVEGSPAPKTKSSEISEAGMKLQHPSGSVHAEAKKRIRLGREKADRVTEVDNSLSDISRPLDLWICSVKKEGDK
jgi:hypothetical protein